MDRKVFKLMMIMIITMETIKIQISEVEGMTVKIPTEFTPHSFNKFYDQMQMIAKSMPNNVLAIDPTPERLKISKWQDKEICMTVLDIWENKGRDATMNWLKDNLNMELDDAEKSKFSSLICAFRAKYKKELSE